MKKIIDAIFWIGIGAVVSVGTLVTVFIMGMTCLSYLNHISPLSQTANDWLVLCMLIGSLAISLSCDVRSLERILVRDLKFYLGSSLNFV